MQSPYHQEIHDSEAAHKSYEPIIESFYNGIEKRRKSFAKKANESTTYSNASFQRLIENPKLEKSTDIGIEWIDSPHIVDSANSFETPPPRKSSFKQTKRVPEAKSRFINPPQDEEKSKIPSILVVKAQQSETIKAQEDKEASIVVEDLDFMPRKRTVSFGICVRPPIPEIQVRPRKVTLPSQVRNNILKNLSHQNLDDFSKITMTIDLEKSECQTKGYTSIKALDKKLSGGQSPTKFLPCIQDIECSEIIENSFDIPLNRSRLNESINIRRNRSNRLDISGHLPNMDQDISIVVENIENDHQEAHQEVEHEDQDHDQDHTEEINDMDMERAEYEEKKRKLDEILLRLAKYKLRRALVVSLSTFAASLCLLLLVFGKIPSYRPVFIITYVFLVYYVTEHIIRVRTPDIIPWKKIENIFDTIDVGYLLLFLFSADLRLSGIPIVTKYIFFPPLVTTVVYFCKSKAPKALRESQTAIRGLYTLQLLLLAGRVDGDLDWPWKAILSFVWLYLGLIGVYCALVGITVVVIIVLTYFKINMYKDVKKSTQIIGFLWSTLFSGLGVVAFISLIGVVDTYDAVDRSDKRVLVGSIITATCLSLFVIVYTLACRHWVMDFLRKFNLDEYDYKEELGFKKVQDDLSRIVRQKKDMYLVMLSSTYFLSLKNSFFMNKDKVQKMKKAIKQAKGEKFKSAFERKLDMARAELKKMGPITIQTLKMEKEGLDQIFGQGGSKIEIVIEKEALNMNKRARSYSLFLERGEGTFGLKTDRRKSSTHSVARKGSSGKVCLSEGDKTYTYDSPSMSPRGQEENLCYICYERAPNAVITACGHGGVCVECAIEAIKANGQCMECRKHVDQLVKINPDPKFKNIIKGYETIKILPSRPPLDMEFEAGSNPPH